MKDLKQLSKFLSLVLRHKPEEIDMSMDANGWVNVDELIDKCQAKGWEMTFETLDNLVITNDKQRFAFNEDYSLIRARQGHSVNIDLQLQATEPLEFLYHGTVEKFIGAIQTNGLQKMQRQHVHLSKDLETAMKVGSRRGKPIILKIKAREMYRNGFSFFLSENGVWLCEQVPSQYIEF